MEALKNGAVLAPMGISWLPFMIVAGLWFYISISAMSEGDWDIAVPFLFLLALCATVLIPLQV